MTPPPTFGRRGLAPPTPAPPPPRPPRRLRSGTVVVGAVALTLGAVGAAAQYRSHACRPRLPGDLDPRPAWCDSASAGHARGWGRGWGGWGFRGTGLGFGHASFGGFGGHGAGHGGGS